MEDARIVEMYFDRDENALKETEKKYGKYCHHIAYNILHSELDAEECVNDTYLRAWGAIPPHRPGRLSTFLGKITRNLALNRYQRDHAQKRGSDVDIAIDELAEIIPDPESLTDNEDSGAISEVLNCFLESLPQNVRVIFVRRYWYMCRISDIAVGLGISESRVKVTLHRTREKLRAYLKKEGIDL